MYDIVLVPHPPLHQSFPFFQLICKCHHNDYWAFKRNFHSVAVTFLNGLGAQKYELDSHDHKHPLVFHHQQK